MEILIFGAGLVGSALGDLAGARAVVTTSRDADIRRPEQVRALVERHQPQWIVLSAAISNVDQCEREPQLAHDVNIGGARNVALAAKESGARLIFLSTDYVFDGEASTPYEVDAPRRGINVYARSKVAAEDEVRSVVSEAIIARASNVFGVHRKCFGTDALQAAGTEFTVVTDKFNCPTYSRDLAHQLLGLVDRNASGTFHCCNQGEANMLDLAGALVKEAGIRDVRFKPTTLAARYSTPRPPYTPMSVTSLERIGIPVRHWREAVPEFVAEMKQLGRL